MSVALIAMAAGSASAAVVANTLPGARPLGVNPGSVEPGLPQQIVFDDVAIAVPAVGQQLEITRVSVTIRVNPGQAATSFSIFAAQTNGAVTPFSFDGLLTRPLFNLGTVNIPGKCSSRPRQRQHRFQRWRWRDPARDPEPR